MVMPEKRMGRVKEHYPDTKHSNRGRRKGNCRRKRYFISSLPLWIEEIDRAVRGHWMVKSCHWYLDVIFREDGNHTLEKQASYNLNIMRKLALNILKLEEVGSRALSLKKKGMQSVQISKNI